MSPRSRSGRFGVLLAGIVLLTGCHTYRPMEAPPPGSMVRVRVPVSSALSNPNASPETASVEGRLLSAGDTLVLAMQNRQIYGAYREIVQFDTLRLARTQTSSVEIREFSTGRSIVLGTAIAAAAGTAAAVAFGLGGGSDEDDSDGGGPVASVVATPSIVSAIWAFLVR